MSSVCLFILTIACLTHIRECSDVSIESMGRAEKNDKSTHKQLDQIRGQQSHQTELLQAIDQQAQQNYTTMASSTVRIEERLDSQSSMMTHLVTTMENMYAYQINLASSQVVVRAFAESQTGDHSDTGVRGLHSNESQNLPQPKSPRIGDFACRCPKSTKRNVKAIPRRLGFFRYTEHKHCPTCPLFIPSSSSTTSGIRFIITGSRMAYLVETGVQWATMTVSPYITCRNILGIHSPAFMLIYLLTHFMGNKAYEL